MALALMLSHVSAASALTVTAQQSDIETFLGGKGGILIFTDNADGAKLKYIDINDPALEVVTLDSAACRDPRLSLDGTRVLYGVDGKLYARKLSGGDRVLIADVGTTKSKGVGYWLREGTTDYVVYCTSTDKYTYDAGTTYKLKIKNGIEPDGTPVEIYDKAYDGGPTPDGQWIGEAYGERHAYNIQTKKEYADFYKADGSKEGQCCNASMAPQTGPYRMVTLVLPHDYFRSWEYDAGQDRWEEYKTYTKPSGTEEWQRPEWSLHPDYITVVAKEGGYDLYIHNAHDPSKRIKVVDGDCDDGDPCTTDTCAGGQCDNVPIGDCCSADGQCDDADPCTNDSCSADNTCSNDPIGGCCTGNSQCDDGDPCTADTCAADNTCSNDPISGCCTADDQCDDGTPCTTDTCADNHTCAFDPVAGCCQDDSDCADSNPCTNDTCDQQSGTCANEKVDGCCAFDVDCDDGDVCTADSCGANNACTNAPIEGCCTADGQCDDDDPCTDDRCRDNRCATMSISGCCTTDDQCDDDSACTDDTCGSDNACSYAPLEGCCKSDDDCTDSNPCTTSTCELASGICQQAVAEGCCQFDTDCDDGDPCTIDRCDPATSDCSHESSVACGDSPGSDAGEGVVLLGGCAISATHDTGWIWGVALALLSLLAWSQRRRRR